MPTALPHPMPLAQVLAEEGIVAIDTGFVRPGFDAAYLIVERGRAAFVDVGVNAGVPRLLAALAAQGLGPEAVDFVIPTHVHLDHAGACGLLMQQLPRATLWVHPRGARHLIDPRALVAGATAVYGEAAMAEAYGEILPVPAERLREAPDGTVLDLAGRPLRLVDTPGHARHHLAVWDARSRSWFTGDTFGMSYPECGPTPGAEGRYLLPSTTPVQFEPGPLKATVARLLEAGPRWVHLTHAGSVGGSEAAVRALGAQMLEQIDAMVALARGLAGLGGAGRQAALKAGLASLYTARWRAAGGALDAAAMQAILANDLELNAQGLGVWLDREAKA